MYGSKLKLLRIIEIMRETSEQEPLTAVQICSKLRSYGIDAEKKSVYRDLNLLKEAGYEIVLSEDNKKGYYLAEHLLEDWEVKVLIDAVSQMQFVSAGSSKIIVNKLLNTCSMATKKVLKSCTILDTKRKTGTTAIKRDIEIVLHAITDRKKIKFQYGDLDEHLKYKLRCKGKFYVVNPYALNLKDGKYYLLGNVDKYNDLAFFRVDKVKNLAEEDKASRSAEELFGANADLKIKEFADMSLYNYSGPKIILKLEAEADSITELVDYFGTNMNLIKSGNKLIAELEVLENEGLYYWLLQYAESTRVLAPERVRNNLLEKLQKIRQRYEIKE